MANKAAAKGSVVVGAQFTGFPKKALPFLKALGFHQNREWFHENKQLYYDLVKDPMADLVEDVSARFEAKKIPLRGNRKQSLYRVNRDVRFSKNKDPYNTHASAILTRSGTKKENGFVYMRFSNERSYIAAGFYGLESDELRGFRELIVREPDTMAKLIKKLEKQGYRFDLSETMKRNPRGFESVDDPQIQEWIKLKGFTFIEELDNGELGSSILADKLFTLGVKSMDFLNFGWRAIDPVREARDLD